ncbi:MAG: phospholipase D-like domain-containing protein [Opitutaceae bacterium]|jgi:phosphatidylserine/phosphatidylglycerophosphate/cardiolipin synthase-like enzyme
MIHSSFARVTGNSTPLLNGIVETTFLRDLDHGGDPDQPGMVAATIADFVAGAQSNLHISIYDFRLSEGLGLPLVNHLIAQAKAGLDVKIAYDHTTPNNENADRPVNLLTFFGGDPKGAKTPGLLTLPDAMVGSLVATKPIAGDHLMHNKYIVRDVGTPQAAVLTGSTNFTDDAWTHQENNLIVVASPALASYYETDFQALWTSGNIASTGADDSGNMVAGSANLTVDFAPGDGAAVDTRLAALVSGARTRIRVCSMLLSSHKILGALSKAIVNRQVNPAQFGGIYDATQMETVLQWWQQEGSPAVETFKSVAAHLAAKHSQPYTPDGLHDFMHNKVLVCDDIVATGSFNFSSSATENAENSLIVQDQALADAYAAYIDVLVKQYGA